MRLISIVAATVPLFTAANGYHNNYGVATFNATEYFKDSKSLEVLSYRACSSLREANGGETDSAGCPTTTGLDYVVPVPIKSQDSPSSPDRYMDYYENWSHDLIWKGANPDYPVLIGLQGHSSDLRMEFEVPGNMTRARPDFDLLLENMTWSNFHTGYYADNLTSVGLHAILEERSILQHLVWTVGQPKDPKWKGDTGTKEGKIVSKGTPFAITPATYIIGNALEVKRQASEAYLLEWKLAVGIGVGIGVPTLMYLCYFLGKYMQRRSNRPRVDKELEEITTS